MKKILVLFLMTLMMSSLSAAHKISDDAPDYQSKSFVVQKGGLLSVDVEPGAVRIESWSKDEVFVEAEGIDERHPDRLSMSQSGNKVTVKYKDRRRHDSNIIFNIKIPAKFDVNIQTSGGSIKQKFELTGNFHAESGGGSIDIDHIIGEVDLETGGGSIQAEKIDGNAEIKTGGGSINVELISGISNVSTGGGSIKLGETGGKVSASTGGGSIKAENASAWIELSTGGGSVTVRKAKYGAKVRTGGGSVQMEDITGMVEITTGGGSIQCELNPGTSGNSQIRTGGGEIELTLPANAKAIVEATVNLGHGWGRHHEKCTISSDFKADIYEGGDDSDELHAVYTLNGGGPKITLETSDSNIQINKISSK
jgi:hypothetical protein